MGIITIVVIALASAGAVCWTAFLLWLQVSKRSAGKRTEEENAVVVRRQAVAQNILLGMTLLVAVMARLRTSIS